MTWRHGHKRDCRRELAGYPNGNWKLDPTCPRCQALAVMLERVAEINHRPERVVNR
jgi:hypothetical protein